MADPVRVNGATGTSATATTNVSFGFTATAGRLLVLNVIAQDDKAGDPDGWSSPTGGSQQFWYNQYFWYKVATGGETSVSYTIASAETSSWIVSEISNIEVASPLDVSNGQGGNSFAISYTTPSVTPSAGRRLALAAIGGGRDVQLTSVDAWLNGFTEWGEIGQGTGPSHRLGVAALALDVNGASSISSGASFNTGCDSTTGIIAVFKVAADAPNNQRGTTLGVG